MAQGRWRGLWAAATAIAVVATAAGCTAPGGEVLVAGIDTGGTPVVGAVDCGFDDRIPAELIVVSDDVGRGPGAVVWSMERPGTGSERPPSELAPPPPPEPTPSAIGRIGMVAIGDPTPPGADLGMPLVDPLPEEVWIEASVFGTDPDPFADVPLRTDGPADTYTVVSDEGTVAAGVGADEASAAVEAECESNDTGFSGGAFLLVMGIGSVLVVLVAVPVGIATRRQFRRAGDAATLRRTGMAPPR